MSYTTIQYLVPIESDKEIIFPSDFKLLGKYKAEVVYPGHRIVTERFKTYVVSNTNPNKVSPSYVDEYLPNQYEDLSTALYYGKILNNTVWTFSDSQNKFIKVNTLVQIFSFLTQIKLSIPKAIGPILQVLGNAVMFMFVCLLSNAINFERWEAVEDLNSFLFAFYLLSVSIQLFFGLDKLFKRT